MLMVLWKSGGNVYEMSCCISLVLLVHSTCPYRSRADL